MLSAEYELLVAGADLRITWVTRYLLRWPDHSMVVPLGEPQVFNQVWLFWPLLVRVNSATSSIGKSQGISH